MSRAEYAAELQKLSTEDLVHRCATMKRLERQDRRPLWQVDTCWMECLRRERFGLISSADDIWQQAMDIVRREERQRREYNARATRELQGKRGIQCTQP